MGTLPTSAILATVIAFSACSRATDLSEYRDIADPRFVVTSSSLAAGQDDVHRNIRIRIGLTAWPDPATLSSDSARLTAGRQNIATLYRVDLARCEIIVQPTEPLEAGLTYHLAISEPLASLQGSTLFEPFGINFTTGTELGPEPPEPSEDATEINAQVFGPNCNCCHAPRVGAYAHVLTIDPTALPNQPSGQVESMVLIKPGDQARSYLMHKVLGLPNIVGDPMPPPYPEVLCSNPWPERRRCGHPDPQVELLGRWIDGLVP